LIIDTHAHLDDEQFKDDTEEVIKRAFGAGICCIINSACNIKTTQAAVDLSEKWENIYATAGIHPHDSCEVGSEYLEKLREYLKHPKVVALGEIGLDYYRDISPRDIQKKVFIEQLELAVEVKVPVVMHVRDAYSDILDIIKKYSDFIPVKVLHCYSGSAEMLKDLLAMGCYISVGGPVTYKNSKKLPEVIKSVPIDRLMVETDCPYLSPEPNRGKRNEPSYITSTVEKIAQIRNEDVSYIEYQTSVNAINAFRLDKKGFRYEK